MERRQAEENNYKLLESNRKPPRRIFPHLKFLVESFNDENGRLSSEAMSNAQLSLIQRHFDEDLVQAYCAAFESHLVAGPTSACGHGLMPHQCGGNTLTRLQLSCLDTISDNFDMYNLENMWLVLSLLPPEHCTALSAMCCRKNQLTDANLFVFMQEHVSVLFIGGTRLSNNGLNTLLPSVEPINILSTPNSWEELCDQSGAEKSVDDVCRSINDGSYAARCPSLEHIVILSPCLTTDNLVKLVSAPFSKLETVTVHGKCSASLCAACTTAVRSSDSNWGECSLCSRVPTYSINHLRNTLGW